MKILLPIDGSEAANEAVEFVRSLAGDNLVEVVILVVSFEPVQYTSQSWVPEWTQQENVRTQSILSKAKQSLDEDCKSVSLIHGSGAVIPCILHQAKKTKKK